MKRKSLLFFLLIALFAPLAMNGQQTAVLNDGTTTMSYVPFYGLYADYGAKGQFIIPATDLANKGITSGCQISKLKFFSNATSSGTYFGSSVIVEVGEVSYTTFSSATFVTSGLTTVLSGTSLSRSSDGTMVVSFSSNYTYNGGNLLISIGGYGSGCPSTSWLGISSTNAGVYGYNSSNSATIPTSTRGTISNAPKTEITYIPGNTPYITLNPTAATVFTGFTQTLTATYGNVSGTPTISYISSNTSVATVTNNGGTTTTVTAIAPGTATITATMTVNGTDYTATCAITVEDPHYCTPNPTSVDGKGITAVTFGTDYVVNNSNSNGLPSSSPFYGDYTSMVGSIEPGTTATVSITYTTGSSTYYNYGTLIWVDWNKDYIFDDSEIVFEGQSSQNSNPSGPHTLDATFTVPANQAADDYRMRIAGADSYFDRYLSGYSDGNHDACFSSTYAVCHDYTLRVATPATCPTPMPGNVTNLMPTAATLNWTGNADDYYVRYRTAASSEAAFFEDFENGIPSTWTTIDSDNDGNNWLALNEISSVYTSYSSTLSDWAHDGSNAAASPSYANGAGCFNSDQWLITPQVNLGGTLKFYAASTYSDLDAFEVLLSTSSNAISDFTTTLQIMHDAPYALNDGTDDWEEVSIDLSSYSGQGYIAIHHVSNCMYFLVIDDFGIYVDEPAGQWLPNNSGEHRTTTSLDIDHLTPETEYEWQVMADCGATDGVSTWSSIATFTTPSRCIAPSAPNTTDITAASAKLNWTGAQENYNVSYGKVFFYEDFENGLPSTWTIIDSDGDGNEWYGADNEYNYAHNGTHMVVSASYSGSALTPDNWLITPQLELKGTMSVWLRNQDPGYPETFAIYLSTNSTNVSDFTTTLIAETNAVGEYTEYTADLSSYNGRLGYIAIRHFNCSDQFRLVLDDFGIYDLQSTTSTASNVTVNGLEPMTDYIWKVQGDDCDGNGGTTDWSEYVFFTTLEGYVKNIIGYGSSAGGYYLIASPIGDVATADVANLTNTDNDNNFDLFYFDHAADLEWVNYKPASGNTPGFTQLVSGKGYLYANSQTVDLVFTGSAFTTNNGEKAIQLDYTDTADGYIVDMPGWNLVGNPFAVNAWFKDNCGFYTLNSAGTEFDAIPAGDGRVVNAMEGVFVEATATGQSVTFTTAQPAKKGSNLGLYVSNGSSVIDRAFVSFGEGQPLHKLQLDRNHTKVYIPQDGQDYAIVCSEEMGETPVNFKAENNGTYSLSLSCDNVEFAYLHLIDNLTGADIDLLQTPSYSFEAKTTDYESRFKLVYATGNNSSDTFAFFSNGSFVINNEGNATLQVIDITGRILKSESVNGCANISVNAAHGVYMLRLINGDNVKVQKVVVR